MAEYPLSRRRLIQEYGAHEDKVKLSRIIVDEVKLAESKAAAERLMEAGAVEWDGVKVEDPRFSISVKEPGSHTLKVGKKKPAVRVNVTE